MADLKPTDPESNRALPHSDNASSTPGFLRLPTELRFQIYDILMADKRSQYELPYKDKISLSPRLFKLPFTRLCRKLRYEAIPYFYGKLWWEVEAFNVDAKCFGEAGWFRTVDPWALMCMKGVRLELGSHECLDPRSVPPPRGGYQWYCGGGKWIEIPFDGGPINAITYGGEVTCAVGLQSDKRRMTAAEKFANATRLESTEVKMRLREMLVELEEIGKTAKAHRD